MANSDCWPLGRFSTPNGFACGDSSCPTGRTAAGRCCTGTAVHRCGCVCAWWAWSCPQMPCHKCRTCTDARRCVCACAWWPTTTARSGDRTLGTWTAFLRNGFGSGPSGSPPGRTTSNRPGTCRVSRLCARACAVSRWTSGCMTSRTPGISLDHGRRGACLPWLSGSALVSGSTGSEMDLAAKTAGQTGTWREMAERRPGNLEGTRGRSEAGTILEKALPHGWDSLGRTRNTSEPPYGMRSRRLLRPSVESHKASQRQMEQEQCWRNKINKTIFSK